MRSQGRRGAAVQAAVAKHTAAAEQLVALTEPLSAAERAFRATPTPAALGKVRTAVQSLCDGYTAAIAAVDECIVATRQAGRPGVEVMVLRRHRAAYAEARDDVEVQLSVLQVLCRA